MSGLRKLDPVAVVLAVALATCTDYDPVAVDGESPSLGHQQAHSSFESANGVGQDASTGAEPFRNRLSIALSIIGKLVPDKTITLSIQGTTSEKLTGGEVRVMLPTMAAMAHAGAGKYPYYPVDKAIPTVARWAVPAMEVGETWRQSLQITLPEEGYYQVAVIATAQGPNEKDPFVLNKVDLERWLLVLADGGRVTHFLDPNAMPAGAIPGEGPFRQSPNTSGSASYATADAAADASDEVTFHAVYYEPGVRKNAAGAEIRINYFDQADEVVRSRVQTVPSSGTVTVDCPDAYEYIVVSVVAPHTNETSGRFLIGGSTAYNSDCGGTRTLISNSYIFIPWRNLNEVIPAMERYFGQYRSAIAWETVFTDEPNTFYWPNSDRITFDYNYYNNKWVAAHEFGHALHHEALGGITNSGSCQGHQISQPFSYDCAFSEGFADYAADAALGNQSRWERGYSAPSGRDAAEIEGNVAALLNDLIDSTNDGNDSTSYPAYYVVRVFETCRADGRLRDDVTDFVWCLERRVNASVHNQSFPRGPNAPSRVTESASEPSGWSASDIRQTWLQNVG